jgi:hypothetical protein
VRWTKEFGTSGDDRLNGVAVAGSRVYVTGATSGTFPGQKKAGHTDAFIAAFKTSGKMLWLHQFGTTSYDAGYSVAAYQSNLFIAGGTDGAFKNQTHAGQSDGFLREYSTAGVKGFTQEFGTTEDDGIGGIVADASGEVIAGTTEGAFPTYTHQGMQDGYVKAFHTDGSDDWTYQFGTTAQDLVKAITLRGSSQIVIGGDSFGGIGEGSVPSSNDVFVAFIDRSGSPGSFLAIGFGSPDDGIDTGNAIVSNSDGVQLAGGTTGQLEGSNLGSEDAYYTHICFC